MTDARGRNPLPVAGMVGMGVAAVLAAAVSWVGWPEMAGTLEEVLGPNRRPSVATKESVAVGIPMLLAGMALLPWPLLHVDRRSERRTSDYQLSAENRRRRARCLSIIWCALALVFLPLHVCLVAEMAGRTTPLYETLAVSFGILLLALAIALPYARQDPATIPPALRRMAASADHGYRRAIPLLRASGAATIALGLLWPIVALAVGGTGMCIALTIAGATVIRQA
ncbi:hypothetical protein [Rhodococcus sp. (in: high G+C Gram-positive bacteria)]|uniref:hypothetical protein n=1 Tax=Rhodococcus sp. TaxID=1831 RepID=UPI003B8A99F0